jgi:hypothetical protein
MSTRPSDRTSARNESSKCPQSSTCRRLTRITSTPTLNLLDHIPPPSKKAVADRGGQLREDLYWDREVDMAWLPTDDHGGDIYGEERD